MREQEITAAIAATRKKDMMDVYGRRLRGTSALTTRALTLGAIPATAMGLLSESNTFGPQTLAVGGTATVLTGAAVSSAVYGVQRLTESKRAQRSLKNQATIREALDDEPIDVIRNKKNLRPGDKNAVTLRWFGADSRYTPDAESSTLHRFEKVVDFADTHEVKDVVFSTNLFAYGDPEALTKQYESKLTTTEKLFMHKKGIPLTDKTADKSLLQLTVAEARTLLEELKATGEISRLEALAEWLIQTDKHHPVITAYNEWKNLGKGDGLKPGITKIIGTGLQRHFSSEVLAEPINVSFPAEQIRQSRKEPPYDEMKRDDDSQEDLDFLPPQSVRFPVDATVMVTPQGLQITKIPRGLQGSGHTKIDFSGWAQIVGTDMETFVTTLIERQGEKLQPHERWKIELALYHVLNKKDDYETVLAKTKSGEEQAPGTEKDSLYQRIVEERPRTNILWPLPRKRGDVSKEKQTIQYRRAFLRNAGKKLSAAALAGTLGTGAGIGWGMAWGQSNILEIACKPENRQALSTNEKDCNSLSKRSYDILGTGAHYIYDKNSELEEGALLRAYQLGIISPDNLKQLAGMVNEKWAKEKSDDLSRRFNLYSGDNSYVGNVENGGDNPAVWSLTPMNGAKTEGYWPTNVQSHITVDQFQRGSIPPFPNKSIMLDNPYLLQLYAPLGTKLTEEQKKEVQLIRELNIPNTPRDRDKPLIGVNGRVLMGTGALFSIGVQTDPDQENWDTYSLPVLQKSDITAGKIIVKDLATDKILAQPHGRFFQREDGTFGVMLPQGLPIGYLDIQYWIDPHATTDLSVRAARPMTAQTVRDAPKLLTDILTKKHSTELTKELGLPADASATQIAHKIESSRKYSFTPYDGAVIPNYQELHLSTSKVLQTAAKYAITMDRANCNVADFMELITTRGVDGDNFLNGIDGFKNNGDKVLSKGESHQWTISSNGNTIDATPHTEEDVTPPAEAFTENHTAHSDLPKEAGEIAAAIAAMTIVGYTGKKALTTGRRRRYEYAHDVFDGSQPILEKDLRILGHLLYAPDSSPLNEAAISANAQADKERTPAERLLTLPADLTRKRIDTLIEKKPGDVSPETRKRLYTIADKAQLARKHRQ